MAEQIRMIGRQTEMEQFAHWMKEHRSRLLCVTGKGGIGKTRLLQEISKRYANISASMYPVGDMDDLDDNYYLQRRPRQARANIHISEIIDFDDRYYNVTSNLEVKIGHLLSLYSENDTDIKESWLNLLRLELIGSKGDPFGQPEENAHAEFIKFFNQVSDHHRIVLLFDTLEAPRGPDISIYLLNLTKQVKNCLIIIAGRNAHVFYEQALKEGVENVNLIELTPLNDKDSREYLQEKLAAVHINIDDDMKQKLLLLAEGMPLLLDLAVEWLARSVPLDWVHKMNLHHPENFPVEEMESLRKEFRMHLISRFSQPKTQMDFLVLWLSRVYPLDAMAIGKLQNLDETQAAELMKDAKSYVFIKTFPDGRISLHDEMRSMIEKIVWDIYDPTKSRRKRDSMLAKEYLRERIKMLDEDIELMRVEELAAHSHENKVTKELDAFMNRRGYEEQRWVLKDHLLEHLLFTDLDQGVKFFVETFDDATKAYKFLLRKNLLDKVLEYHSKLNPDQLYMVESREVKFRLDNNEYDTALNLVDALLKRHNITPEKMVDMLIQHGNIQMRRGEVQKALKDFQKAVKFSEENKLDNWIVKSYNARGWCYRTIGNLERAMNDYNRAFDISLSLPDQRQIAAIYNNMGNVLAYQGMLNDGVEKCSKALDIWKRDNYGRGVGTALCTLGEIYRRFNRPQESETNYNNALDVFTSEDDLEWMSVTRCGRGQLYWELNRLKDAEEDLEWALENGPGYLKPRVYHSWGEIYRSKAQYDKALDQFQKAHNMSRSFGDRLNELKSFVSIINVIWYFQTYERWHEFYQEYQERYCGWNGRVNLRLIGSLLRNLGDLAISHQDRQDALQFYFEGIMLIAQYETKSLYKVEAQMAQSEKRILAACPDDTLSWLGNNLGDLCRKEHKLENKRADLLDIFHQWAHGAPYGKAN